MKEQRLALLVEEALNKRLKGIQLFNDEAAFVGYNPIEKIRGALFHWIAVPFNGTEVFCQLRCPNATQLEQCGDISNITIDVENKEREVLYDEVIKIRNYQESLCRLVFNIPTFDQIAVLAGEDFLLSEKKEELENLKKKFDENKDGMTETEKKTIGEKIKINEMLTGYFLPDDTMAFITKWAMGNDVSDIKRITKESLLRAASLAKLHNKSPSDYISGVFTDYNKKEIDLYATSILNDFLKEKEVVETKYKWLLGGRKRTGT